MLYTIAPRTDNGPGRRRQVDALLRTLGPVDLARLALLIATAPIAVAKDWVEDRGFPRGLATAFVVVWFDG